MLFVVVLTGQCHEMNIYKYKIKFLHASMKSLTNCENPSSNPLQRGGGVVPAFRKPPVTLKVVPKAACDSENCSESQQCM
jgi:hypothetical protein